MPGRQYFQNEAIDELFRALFARLGVQLFQPAPDSGQVRLADVHEFIAAGEIVLSERIILQVVKFAQFRDEILRPHDAAVIDGAHAHIKRLGGDIAAPEAGIFAPHQRFGVCAPRPDRQALKDIRCRDAGGIEDGRRQVEVARERIDGLRCDTRTVHNERNMKVLVIEQARQIAAEAAMRCAGLGAVIAGDDDSGILGYVVPRQNTAQFAELLIDQGEPHIVKNAALFGRAPLGDTTVGANAAADPPRRRVGQQFGDLQLGLMQIEIVQQGENGRSERLVKKLLNCLLTEPASKARRLESR